MSIESTQPHYGAGYFARQRINGDFGAWADLTKFSHHIDPHDTVIDFGCGTGRLLEALNCHTRIGVDVNPHARAEAAKHLDLVFAAATELASECADVVISNHALEHVHHPLNELRELFRALRPGGKIVAVVPCETWRSTYVPHDPNRHLYSWSPMCLGNLLTEAGFSVESSKPYIHKWPPKHYRQIARYGRTAFDLACRIYGRLTPSWAQAIAVARRPTAVP